MSVFTFMGANIMKHDNAYNFKIINQTIDAIIPPLIEVSNISIKAVTDLALKI